MQVLNGIRCIKMAIATGLLKWKENMNKVHSTQTIIP